MIRSERLGFFGIFRVDFLGANFRGEEDESRGTGFKAGGGCRRGQYDGVASDVAVLICMLLEVALTDGPCSAELHTSLVDASPSCVF